MRIGILVDAHGLPPWGVRIDTVAGGGGAHTEAEKFWGYLIPQLKKWFLGSFSMSLKTRFFTFLAPQAPKIRFWGWFSSDSLKENHPKLCLLCAGFGDFRRFSEPP